MTATGFVTGSNRGSPLRMSIRALSDAEADHGIELHGRSVIPTVRNLPG